MVYFVICRAFHSPLKIWQTFMPLCCCVFYEHISKLLCTLCNWKNCTRNLPSYLLSYLKTNKQTKTPSKLRSTVSGIVKSQSVWLYTWDFIKSSLEHKDNTTNTMQSKIHKCFQIFASPVLICLFF